MAANKLPVWLNQIRAPFLLLPVMLMSISGALAYKDQVFHLSRFLLALVGIILTHVGVNLINEHSDHQTGIDHKTKRTPFSGGSGNLQTGATTTKQVWWTAIAVMAIAFIIGLYLSWQVGWLLLILILAGGFIVFFYTSLLSRFALGELSAGLGLGSFVVLGGYYAQAGTITSQLLLLSLPSGILTAMLLLLNEFPDSEADKQGGRRHLVILLGHKIAAIIYTASLVACYFILVLGVACKFFPSFVLLSLLTVPLAIKASTTALNFGKNFEKMIPAQGANVGLVLGTNLLIAIGCLI